MTDDASPGRKFPKGTHGAGHGGPARGYGWGGPARNPGGGPQTIDERFGRWKALSREEKLELTRARGQVREAMMAEMVDIAFGPQNPMVKLQAIEKYLDRTEGKPVQRNLNVETTELDNLSDEMLHDIATGGFRGASEEAG